MELIRRSIFQCKACGSIPLRRAILRSCSGQATGGEYVEEYGKVWPRRVVSGLQPTGSLHLGNYFGAVKRCVDLQNSGQDLTLFIANLHALTPGKGVKTEHVEALSAQLLAAGVCPERSVFFIQSMVPRHAELCWILACTASYARVAQLHGFKTSLAAAGEQGAVPLGILLYPVLQAADVLVHRATHVPVGADQIQHLQLAANLAKTFTSRYGPVFPTPRPLIADEGTGSERIRSLRDPSKKMSKSDPDPKSRILLTDTDEQIQLKIRKSVTDCNPQVTYEPETRPGVSNLVSLHCLCEDLTPEEAVEIADGLTTFQYKSVVARSVCATVAPVRDRIEKLLADKDRLNAIMRHGAARARKTADEVYDEVCEKVGLAPRRTIPLSVGKKNVKAKAVKEKVSVKAQG